VLLSSDFIVTPGIYVLVCVLGFFLGGAITAAKGRWGWTIAVLLTGGVAGWITAWLPARPGSLWARIARSASGSTAQG
jgi:hypothetical protein